MTGHLIDPELSPQDFLDLKKEISDRFLRFLNVAGSISLGVSLIGVGLAFTTSGWSTLWMSALGLTGLAAVISYVAYGFHLIEQAYAAHLEFHEWQ